MQLDETFYESMVEEFKKAIEKTFGDNIKIEKVNCLFKHMGNFQICFLYETMNLRITVENEIRTFTIMIEDEDGASNTLYRIKRFNNILDKKNIKESLSLLKEILEKNQFNLYIYKGDKVYRKNANGVKRVKDVKELMNE